MPKYLVCQQRQFIFYQEVEAETKEKAIDIAFEYGEWEQDQNHAEYNYEVEEVPTNG